MKTPLIPLLLDVLQARAASMELQSAVLMRATALAKELEALTPSAKSDFLRACVTRITASESLVEIEISRPGLAEVLRISSGDALACGAIGAARVSIEARFKRIGGETRLILGGTASDTAAGQTDPKIVAALACAHQWARMFERSSEFSIRRVAAAAGYSETYASRILRLAYLAPDIVEAILAGRQPRRISLRALLQGVPLSWNAQRAKFGFSQP